MMSRLLRAGVRRYIHNIVFWLALVITGIVAVIGASQARSYYFDDVYCVVEFIIFAVMISWLIGREYEEGIFRNKVISGHTKGQIYVSELILGVGSCLLMFLLFGIIFIVFNSYVFTKVAFGVLAKLFLDVLLVNICFAVILVTLSCIIPKRAIVAIVNIILVLGIIFASYSVKTVVLQEEYNLEWEYEEHTVTDEFGTHTNVTRIEGSEYKVKNPDYIDGPVRTVFETLYDILPYGHITQYIALTNDWFGYYRDSPGVDITGETSSKDLTVTKDDITEINCNLIWSVIINGVICAIGYTCFRKKELR